MSANRFIYLFVLTLLFGCSREGLNSELFDDPLPAYFPEMKYPEDNLPSPERIALGKRLFYDPILSIDSSISCASCHHPEKAFADDRRTTPGVFDRPGTRNVPSLANVGFLPRLLREGSLPTLEMQILVPIQEHNEFSHNIVKISEQLNNQESYVKASQAAYRRNPDPFVITRALAAFERTLISYRSKYDQYLQQRTQFTAQEKRGFDLFHSNRTKCAQCHGGFNFDSDTYTNNGLYTQYQDPGRGRFTKEKKDSATFRVPSLRNVSVTAPYMHDGSLADLYEVIEHYASGGKSHPNKSDWITGFEISEQEKQDLIAFLETLTDPYFLSDPRYLPEN